VDIMATCVDIAGATYPVEHRGQKIKPMEGTSLRPAFAGQPLNRTKPLAWEHEANRGLRDGKWKLVAKENSPWELYDIDADRSELHDLASAEPQRVKQMAAAWDAWAARCDVLPLGAWRGKDAKAADTFSKQRRFVLKAGDHLDRSKAPAIVDRAFTITVKFDTGAAKRGVIVAQGGSAHGYALFLAEGKLTFLVRSGKMMGSVSTPEGISGAHVAQARVDAKGMLTLWLDGKVVASGSTGGFIGTMPVDGLDVGSDSAGAVGPYQTPNTFTGTIESVTIELD
jgi:arylsulfatase